MKFSEHRTRWTAGLVITAFAVALMAPVAEAGHGRGNGNHRRYKGRGYSERVIYRPAPRRAYYYRRHSSAGPAFAGFLGGLAVGTILGSQSSRPAYAAPSPAPDDYYYYDPYCHSRYSSLDRYTFHVRHCSHPRVVRVIEIETGSCVDTYRYNDGRWADYADYDDGYGYRGRSNGGCEDD